MAAFGLNCILAKPYWQIPGAPAEAAHALPRMLKAIVRSEYVSRSKTEEK